MTTVPSTGRANGRYIPRTTLDALSCLEGRGAVARFEEAFARLAGAPFSLALCSGTAALQTALLCGLLY